MLRYLSRSSLAIHGSSMEKAAGTVERLVPGNPIEPEVLRIGMIFVATNIMLAASNREVGDFVSYMRSISCFLLNLARKSLVV